MQMTRDPLLNEVQAAEILGVKPATLQVWRSTGRYPLAYVKTGRLVRYRASAIEAFIALRTVEIVGAVAHEGSVLRTTADARATTAKPRRGARPSKFATTGVPA